MRVQELNGLLKPAIEQCHCLEESCGNRWFSFYLMAKFSNSAAVKDENLASSFEQYL